MIRYTLYFSGRVQGVGFRATTRDVARSFAVSGHVQNLDDGRVLLVAEGERAELDRFIAKLRGVMGQYIKEHTQAESVATGEFGTPGVDALTIKRW
jgi:acylphosphatase